MFVCHSESLITGCCLQNSLTCTPSGPTRQQALLLHMLDNYLNSVFHYSHPKNKLKKKGKGGARHHLPEPKALATSHVRLHDILALVKS